jgi:uncharacterized protein YukE
VTAPSSILPLTGYLQAERVVMTRMADDLLDAQQDLQQQLARLAARNGGVGAQVRQAQLSQINQALQRTMDALWKEIGEEIIVGGKEVADVASSTQAVYDRILFNSAGVGLPEELIRAEEAYARNVVEHYWSRLNNKISLSEQVYRTEAMSEGWVDRAVNRVILQGGSWKDIADAVKPFIDPNTPGGVSYAAKRLGRTELNNAFHESQIRLGQENPWVQGQQWHLSGRHPKKDECDTLANKTVRRDLGRGVYPDGNVPRKPHPQCLCYLTPKTVSEDEFFTRLLAGDYEDATEGRALSAASAALRAA